MLHACSWTPSTSPSVYLGPKRSSQSEVGCWDPSSSPLFPPPPMRGDPLASAAPAWRMQLGSRRSSSGHLQPSKVKVRGGRNHQGHLWWPGLALVLA